jgi:hypothetical protein|tara:strand:+ start:274 stop:531 length:258 start_codon:yes stop_codon:yes gene_type:complete
MEKTITVNTDDNSLTIEQRAPDKTVEGVGVSSDGFNIHTGLGWGVDIAIVLFALSIIYIGKKYVDRWFAMGKFKIFNEKDSQNKK